MSFFEPLSAVQDRSRAEWNRGTADFRQLGILGKAAAAGAGLGGAAGGVVYALPKTVGVTAYEFYSQSFGDKRGRNLFDYATSAPVLQMLVTGAIAEGVGAALSHFHIIQPWSIIPTTFVWGALSYISTQLFRYLPYVVGFSAHGGAGNSMHWIKNRLQPDAKPAPAPQPRPAAGEPVERPARAARPIQRPVPQPQPYDYPVATRSQLNRARLNASV